MPWDPQQYQRFERERAAPFEDLLALIRRAPNMSVVDLGCGTGGLTQRLADALAAREVLGLDSSAEMLSRVRKSNSVRYEQQTIEEFAASSTQWDLVFSNAALHWVPDHETLIPCLVARVARGGQFAAQLPSNQGHPSHGLLTETASEEPFRSMLGGWTPKWPVLSIDRYAELLYAAGLRELQLFEKIYPYELPDGDAVVEWMRGTTMIPFLERLKDASGDFIEAYRQKIRRKFPSSPVFFGFRRILWVGRA